MDPIQVARWDVFGNVIRRTCPDCTTGQSRLSWYSDWFKLMRAPAWAGGGNCLLLRLTSVT